MSDEDIERAKRVLERAGYVVVKLPGFEPGSMIRQSFAHAELGAHPDPRPAHVEAIATWVYYIKAPLRESPARPEHPWVDPVGEAREKQKMMEWAARTGMSLPLDAQAIPDPD